jgi:hypothetical protein
MINFGLVYIMFDIHNKYLKLCFNLTKHSHDFHLAKIYMIPWPPKNPTCWKKKLKVHEEKRNRYFIENS